MGHRWKERKAGRRKSRGRVRRGDIEEEEILLPVVRKERLIFDRRPCNAVESADPRAQELHHVLLRSHPPVHVTDATPEGFYCRLVPVEEIGAVSLRLEGDRLVQYRPAPGEQRARLGDCGWGRQRWPSPRPTPEGNPPIYEL